MPKQTYKVAKEELRVDPCNHYRSNGYTRFYYKSHAAVYEIQDSGRTEIYGNENPSLDEISWRLNDPNNAYPIGFTLPVEVYQDKGGSWGGYYMYNNHGCDLTISFSFPSVFVEYIDIKAVINVHDYGDSSYGAGFFEEFVLSLSVYDGLEKTDLYRVSRPYKIGGSVNPNMVKKCGINVPFYMGGDDVNPFANDSTVFKVYKRCDKITLNLKARPSLDADIHTWVDGFGTSGLYAIYLFHLYIYNAPSGQLFGYNKGKIYKFLTTDSSGWKYGYGNETKNILLVQKGNQADTGFIVQTATGEMALAGELFDGSIEGDLFYNENGAEIANVLVIEDLKVLFSDQESRGFYYDKGVVTKIFDTPDFFYDRTSQFTSFINYNGAFYCLYAGIKLYMSTDCLNWSLLYTLPAVRNCIKGLAGRICFFSYINGGGSNTYDVLNTANLTITTIDVTTFQGNTQWALSAFRAKGNNYLVTWGGVYLMDDSMTEPIERQDDGQFALLTGNGNVAETSPDEEKVFFNTEAFYNLEYVYGWEFTLQDKALVKLALVESGKQGNTDIITNAKYKADGALFVSVGPFNQKIYKVEESGVLTLVVSATSGGIGSRQPFDICGNYIFYGNGKNLIRQALSNL